MQIEGPLAKELREIAAGTRQLPTTNARRHHFVPAFLLSQFAVPQTRKGWLYQLETSTGKPQRTTPDSTAFEKDLYTQETEGERDLSVEAFFSVVERHAAPALQRLIANPAQLSAEDRQTISYFLAFQYTRGPVAIAHTMATRKAALGVFLGVHAGDAVAFARTYREAINEDASEEEIARVQEEVHELILSGSLEVGDPKAEVFKFMLSAADTIAPTVEELHWVLAEAGEGEFVTSDRPLAMHDPTPKFPWSGHAWVSSANAETSFPLTPHHCLCFEIDDPGITTKELDGRGVRALNLRTYGWASTYIYGRSQEIVTRVRREAKSHPGLVIAPRRGMQVILEEADPDDPNVGREHPRGWPRGLWVPGRDGRDQFVSYTVVDPSDPKTVLAAIEDAPALGRRIIERAVDRGEAPPERLG